MCRFLFVCLYVINIFKASEYLITDQSKLSEIVQANDNDLPGFKVGNFVNNNPIKKYDDSTITNSNTAMKGPLKCK